MTGIYNRRKFFELATFLFTKNTDNFFLITIDIDFFKKVNDNFGHDAGDFVIRRITQIICDSLPQDSIFARMGGEEFIVIISNEKNEKDVISLFEDIRNKICTETINYNGNIINTTVSAGIVQRTNNNKTIDEVVKNSDLALYEAKKSGRNKVIYR
jgi:diguanylate cyclase (GGDEF)-like protein